MSQNESAKTKEELVSLVLRLPQVELTNACRMIQTQLGINLIHNISVVAEDINSLASLAKKVRARYTELIEAALDSNTLGLEECTDALEAIESNQLKVCDLQRKIVQGKDLIGENNYSEEEKMVINLLHSFKTEDEKKAFLKLAQDTLKSQNDLEFEELPK